MMPRRMTVSEAVELLEQCFEASPDQVNPSLVEIYVSGLDVGQARQDIESYLAFIPNDYDADTISVTPDHDDETRLDMVRVTIMTEAQHAHA